MFYKVLEHCIPECSTKFYNILLENSSSFQKVPDYYAPNFEEVEGAYWFGSVCLSVHLSVCNTFWQLRNSRTPYARILKF